MIFGTGTKTNCYVNMNLGVYRTTNTNIGAHAFIILISILVLTVVFESVVLVRLAVI